MRKFIISFLVLISFCSCFINNIYGQDTSSYDLSKKSIKLNIYFSWYNWNKTFDIGNISPVLLIKDRWHNMHEIELTTFNISKSYDNLIYSGGNVIGRDTSIETNIGLRYQFDYFFLKKRINKFRLYNGASISFKYYKINIIPYAQTRYPIKVATFISSFALVPGIKFSPTEKLFFDMDFPLTFITYFFIYQRIYIPTLTKQQQKTSGIGLFFSLPNIFQIRLGVGINL